MWKIFIAHAEGEQSEAEKLAKPLQEAGYEVIHYGTLLVGESLLTEAQKVLNAGGPVVLCATCKAAGSKWIRRISNAARKSGAGRLFVMQMEGEADVEDLVLDEQAGAYWEAPDKTIRGLLEALRRYYPQGERTSVNALRHRAEATYRRLVLESCDLIHLANLPEGDRHIATRRLEVRRLYVPLRVRVEALAENRLGEGDITALESRLDAARHVGHSLLEREENRFPIGERLASTRRLVILGDPGAGKSTLLRWLATAYLLRLKQDPEFKLVPDVTTLPDRNWLPILIRCRDLDPDAMGEPLDDVLRHVLRKSEMEEEEAEALRAVLREKLAQDEALLLIDGLDEIADTSARIQFCEQLERIRAAFPKAPIVVTSRIVGYREMGHRIGHGFEHVLVDDLLRQEKNDFVRRWCELTEAPERQKATAQELISDIHSTDRIERLTGNPMLLTTMALVKRKVGTLPRRRAELYWEAVHVLLNWRRAEMEDPLDAREARPQLQYLAYAMCDRGVQRLREDEVLSLLEQLRAERPQLYAVRRHDPEEFLALLERRTGILVQTGVERHLGIPVPVYEFRHLTFQEYLAARALVEQCFPHARTGSLAETIAPLAVRTALSSAHVPSSKPSWHEVIRLFVACCPSREVDPVLRAILEVQPGEDDAITARPRAVLAAPCLADEPDVSESVAQDVLDRLGTVIDHREQGGPSGIRDAFLELVTSRWGERAFFVLGREFLGRDASNRKAILEVARHCHGMSPIYSWPLEDEVPAAWVQPEAPEKVVAAALQLAAHASQGGGTIEAVPHLMALLSQGGAVSHAAAYALEALRFGYRISLWSPNREQASRLSEFVTDQRSDPGAVHCAIHILGNSRARHTAEAMISRLKDPDVEIKMAAASALGLLGDLRAVDPLIQLLDDPDPLVHERAAFSLGRLRDARAFWPLLQKLGEADPFVRHTAVTALGRLISARTAPGSSPPSFEREPTAIAMLLRELLSLLNDPESSRVQSESARVLGLLKNRAATEPLLERWQYQPDSAAEWSHISEALEVVHALGAIGDPRAVDGLRLGLETEEPEIEAATAVALGKLGEHRVIEWLIPKLQHENDIVRLWVAAAMTKLGDMRGLEMLSQALESDLRLDALNALAASYGDTVDMSLVGSLIPTYGFFIAEQREIDTSDIDILSKYFVLPSAEVRQRLEQLSENFPRELAAHTFIVKKDETSPPVTDDA